MHMLCTLVLDKQVPRVVLKHQQASVYRGSVSHLRGMHRCYSYKTLDVQKELRKNHSPSNPYKR